MPAALRSDGTPRALRFAFPTVARTDVRVFDLEPSEQDLLATNEHVEIQLDAVIEWLCRHAPQIARTPVHLDATLVAAYRTEAGSPGPRVLALDPSRRSPSRRFVETGPNSCARTRKLGGEHEDRSLDPDGGHDTGETSPTGPGSRNAPTPGPAGPESDEGGTFHGGSFGLAYVLSSFASHCRARGIAAAGGRIWATGEICSDGVKPVDDEGFERKLTAFGLATDAAHFIVPEQNWAFLQRRRPDLVVSLGRKKERIVIVADAPTDLDRLVAELFVREEGVPLARREELAATCWAHVVLVHAIATGLCVAFVYRFVPTWRRVDHHTALNLRDLAGAAVVYIAGRACTKAIVVLPLLQRRTMSALLARVPLADGTVRSGRMASERVAILAALAGPAVALGVAASTVVVAPVMRLAMAGVIVLSASAVHWYTRQGLWQRGYPVMDIIGSIILLCPIGWPGGVVGVCCSLFVLASVVVADRHAFNVEIAVVWDRLRRALALRSILVVVVLWVLFGVWWIGDTAEARNVLAVLRGAVDHRMSPWHYALGISWVATVISLSGNALLQISRVVLGLGDLRRAAGPRHSTRIAARPRCGHPG